MSPVYESWSEFEEKEGKYVRDGCQIPRVREGEAIAVGMMLVLAMLAGLGSLGYVIYLVVRNLIGG